MIDKYYFDDFQDDNQNFYDTLEKKLNSNDHKISDLIDNKKTLKILKSNNPENINFQQNETLKNLPNLLLDLQEALKKSNLNVLEMKESMTELVKKDKKSKKRIKDLENEIDNTRQQIDNMNNIEYELKNKIERILNEDSKLRENYEELQKKHEEKTRDYKSLKKKALDLESRYNYGNRELEIREKMINEMNEMINTYKKTLSDFDAKNQKYKSNNNMLKEEINNIEDKLKEITYFKEEISSLQQEVNTLKNKTCELESENAELKKNEIIYKEENKVFDYINKTMSNKLKKLKTDLKSELNEKITILKELENLKNSQKTVFEKQESLKSIIENTTNKKEEFNSIIDQLRLENQSGEIKIKQFIEENTLINEKYSQLKSKYRLLVNDFESLQKQSEKMENELSNKNTSKQDIYKITDKFEEEIFNLKCENNLWKNAFIEIAKYKLISFEEKNLDQIIQIDRNYIINTPDLLRDKVENITSFFKTLVDEETYKTNSTKTLKEALMNEQEKNAYLTKQLYNEMMLRRKIHNKYMNIRGNLRVMCRIRPFIDTENNFSISNNIINIQNENKVKKFDLDYIFNQKSSQQEVYDEVSLLVQSMQNGNNVCIIAYGQTSTGKTFTIQGPGKETPGIAVRAAKEIFEIIDTLKNNKKDTNLLKRMNSLEVKSNTVQLAHTKLSISIIEIYNENIYNLLLEGTPQLNLFENSSGNLIIPDLNPIIINNFNEARKIFNLASKLRKTKTTSYNERSSRSHCIFSFHLKIVDEEGNITRSKLHIIDLAGSERLSKSNITDESIKKESISINMSLTALSNVLNSLALKQNHIPYRDSKLTHFLKDSLGENFNILLLLHISPNIRDFNETIYTLDFGTRIAKLCKHKTGRETTKDEKAITKLKASK